MQFLKFRRETNRKITSTPCPPGGPRVVWRWSPRPQVGHIMEPGFPAQQGKYSVGNILCHVRNAHLVFFSLPSLLKGPLPATSKCLVYFPTVKKMRFKNQKFLFLSKHHHSTFGISPHIIIPKTYVLHKNNLALSTITSGTMLVIYRIQSQLAFSLGDSFSSLPRNTINNRGLWTKIQNKQNICIMSLYAITYAAILSNQRNIILQTATKTVFPWPDHRPEEQRKPQWEDLGGPGQPSTSHYAQGSHSPGGERSLENIISIVTHVSKL